METALGSKEDIEPQRVGRMMPSKTKHTISNSW